MWAEDLGAGATTAQGFGIAVDSTGNVYTTGYFYGTGNFAGGPGTHNLTSTGGYNAYVSKLDANGGFVFADDLGAGATNALGNGIAVDSTGNVYTTGYFHGTGNFAGGTGTHNLTSSPGGATMPMCRNWMPMVALSSPTTSGPGLRLLTAMASRWIVRGTSTRPAISRVRATLLVGTGTHNLTSIGGYYNAYVSKLDTNGGFVFADDLGAGASAQGQWHRGG